MKDSNIFSILGFDELFWDLFAKNRKTMTKLLIWR